MMKYILQKSNFEHKELINKKHQSALHIAAEGGFVDVVRLLVNDASEEFVRLLDEHNKSALDFAVEREDIAMVELLVKPFGYYYPYGKDTVSSTPLHVAVSNGSLEISRILRENVVDEKVLRLRDGRSRDTPLHIAARNGNLEMVKILATPVDKSKNPPTNSSGESALHCAVAKGHLEVVKELLRGSAFDYRSFRKVKKNKSLR
eukprot:TRINITY_DN11921_c0_g1_i4.p1 TRINITY_DN11921_c0_g1~~TRINITY_DN11921_c0_g1_i4.p1  ORF type:complete len:204 (+),score=41.28 TRINITY_DN11921_c0_g1_i4:278-889(+)